MTTCPADVDVQLSACLVCAALMETPNEECREALANAGMIAAITTALKRHMDNKGCSFHARVRKYAKNTQGSVWVHLFKGRVS
jgi:hypothetical protein